MEVKKKKQRAPADGRTKKSGEPKKAREEYDSAHVLGPTPSRSQIDGETQKYFSEVKELIETITDDAERATLCSNALAEAQGKELKLASHPSCGRALEKLLESSGVVHCVTFLGQCTSLLPSMAMDPFGSHVAETLLRCISEALQQGQENDMISSIHDALKKTSEEFQQVALDIMTNQYGSHVLRRLIYLLAGLSFDAEKDARSKKLGRANAYATKALARKSIHLDFPEILKRLVGHFLAQSKEALCELRTDTHASLVFQTMLKALCGSGHDTTKSVSKILGVDPAKDWKPAEVEQIVEMMENQNASHLMEVIVEEANEELYVTLFERVFLPNLKRLATHQFSNFVVQTLVTSTQKQEQVEAILKELEQDFSELIKNKKAGVIMSILGACSRYRPLQKEVSRAVVSALCPQPALRDSLVTRLLLLESDRKGAKRMSTLGCAMLQTIFTFSQDYIQLFNKNFAALETAELLKAAKDQAGCHVVEAFLKSSASVKQKSAVIARFKGHFGELATDSKTHYLVLKCYDAADMKLKEMVVSELVPIQQALLKTNHGPFVVRKLNVSMYEKVPDRWRASVKSKQAVKAGYAELFGSGKDDAAGESATKKKRKGSDDASSGRQEKRTKV